MDKSCRKVLAILLIFTLFLANAPAVRAESADDQPVTLVPVRPFFEDAGGSVYWDDESRSVRINLEDAVFLLFADSPVAQRNEEALTLQYGLVIEQERALIADTDLALLLHGPELYSGYLGTTINALLQAAGQAMELLSIPGMTVAIVDAENGFTWTQGFGFADTGVPVDEHTLFGLGSISKSFTAISVMQLAEAGIIDLDEPVVTYLPDFHVPADQVSGAGDYRNITPRLLLSHASGMQADWIPGFMTTGGYYPGYMHHFLDFIEALPLGFPEASAFSYSNTAYTLLGVLVAEMAGKDDCFDGFADYARDHILTPLGMDSSTFILEEKHMPYLAKPYIDAATQDEFIYFNPLSAGGLYANASDMARFMHTILSGGAYEGEGGRILSPDSLKQMLTLQNFDFREAPDLMGDMRFGLGFYQTEGLDGFAYMGHGGNLIHYHASMAFDPDSGLGVLAAVNSISGIAAPKSVAASVLQSAIFEKTGTLRLPASDAEVEPVGLTPEELQKFEGFYTFAGAEELIRITVLEDGLLYLLNMPGIPVPLELTPLSDGSFVNPMTGLRFWFEDFHGDTFLYLGEFKSILAGGKLDPELVLADESTLRWVGTYYPVLPEGQVSGMSRAEVGVDENGFAYVRVYSLHGQSPYSPLIRIDGDFYAGCLAFVLDDDGSAWLHVQGLGMQRLDP